MKSRGRWQTTSPVCVSLLLVAFALLAQEEPKPRARDLGIPFDGTPGPFNAITDVKGVRVGHTTLNSGEGKLVVGQGPVRTGVTAILPRGRTYDPLIADIFWVLPVVAETYDGGLNDINGFHVKKRHVFAALDGASSGPVAEGNVGGGTAMGCHGFKCGIGTSSRRLEERFGSYTVGVLVQANYGGRDTLTIAGVPIGKEITDLRPQYDFASPGSGSIIVVVATDAPLLPHQLKRLARRVPIGVGKMGGVGTNGSGDIFIAFSTANLGAATRTGIQELEMLPNDEISPLFLATVQATEEAIVNALVAAESMVGINGNTVYALPHDRLREVLRKYNRLSED